jgi:raffinose/stachyose/melibiose transport system substrate-binding protein
MTRRAAGALGAAVAVIPLAAVAGACGFPGQAATPAQPATGSVLFWRGAPAGPAIEFWTKTEALLRETHPKLTYTRESPAVPQGQTFLQALIAASAAGSGPDVYEDDVVLNRMQVTVPAGIPRAVDEYHARLPNLKKVFPWTRKVAQLKGKQWGIPHEVEFVSVFYNKGVFEKANLKPAPQTWDDFQRLARSLASGGAMPLLVSGISQYRHLHGYLMSALLGKAGMDEIVHGNGRWDSGGCVDAAQLLLDLGAGGTMPRDAFDPAWTIPADFFNGRAAQTVTGTWSIASFEQQKRQSPGFDFGQYAIPSPKAGLTPQFCGGVGGGFSITSQAKTPDAGATFVDFLYSPAIQKHWIEILFQIPPVPFKVEDYTISSGNRDALTLIHQFEQSGIASAFWMVQTAQQFDEYGPLLERVLKREITPKEMGLRMQQLWDEFKRQFR